MRTVFTNDMLVHVFAQQTQTHGRSNSMHFEGDTLYSYRTPIARIVWSKADPKRRVMLITSESYGVTTAQHKSRADQTWGYAVFHVPSLGVSGGMHNEGAWGKVPKVDHKRNLSFMVGEYYDYVSRLKRARDLWREVSESLADAAAPIHRYTETFGLKHTLDVAGDTAIVLQARAEREAHANTPQAIAKRAKSAEYREAKKRKHIAEAVACYREALRKSRLWAVQPGRCITRNGIMLVTIHRCEHPLSGNATLAPSEADDLTHRIVALLNKYGE